VDGPEFLKCIEELLRVDKSWIPKGFGYSLYLRPTLIATWVTKATEHSEESQRERSHVIRGTPLTRLFVCLRLLLLFPCSPTSVCSLR
jgi:hypothetical protein